MYALYLSGCRYELTTPAVRSCLRQPLIVTVILTLVDTYLTACVNGDDRRFWFQYNQIGRAKLRRGMPRLLAVIIVGV
jgi:hypothetical protein